MCWEKTTFYACPKNVTWVTSICLLYSIHMKHFWNYFVVLSNVCRWLKYISKEIMALRVGQIPQKCNVSNHGIAQLIGALVKRQKFSLIIWHLGLRLVNYVSSEIPGMVEPVSIVDSIKTGDHSRWHIGSCIWVLHVHTHTKAQHAYMNQWVTFFYLWMRAPFSLWYQGVYMQLN